MRHKGVGKEETKRKVVEAAGHGFRKHGYSGIGVDGLAKAAGVTSGAFYSHFGSKGGAFDVALDVGLDEVIDGVAIFQNKHGADWVEAFAQYYLGRSHRGNLKTGCAMATLTPDVVRSSPEVHTAYEKKMTQIVDLISSGLAGGSDEDRRVRAWALLGVLIGGINVARAMKSVKASDEVAKAIIMSAVKAAGRARSTAPDAP
ncbi:MAG: TetR/AcrR family transcriptional repressor of nem operon [Granulosicoccus sp.]